MNCPECNKPLEEEEEGLVCWNCDIIIPLDNEIDSNYSMRKEMENRYENLEIFESQKEHISNHRNIKNGRFSLSE